MAQVFRTPKGGPFVLAVPHKTTFGSDEQTIIRIQRVPNKLLANFRTIAVSCIDEIYPQFGQPA
ncbi:hypothetical protein D3C78_1770990 [compost metagenome]